jgi:hypothetical protein
MNIKSVLPLFSYNYSESIFFYQFQTELLNIFCHLFTPQYFQKALFENLSKSVQVLF